ncbi:MAG: phage holin family protein [Nitrospirae bacterium]|nr:phage holin family protein [Nitrospirota bacterium]
MPGFVIRWLINAVALLLISQVIRGIEVDGVVAALAAAAVLGVFNAVLRPILLILTLPLTIVTLGLFALVLNGFMLYLVGSVVKGFSVHGFWSAVFGAILLSLVSGVANAFINDRGRIEIVDAQPHAR